MVHDRASSWWKKHFHYIHPAGDVTLQPVEPEAGSSPQQFPLVVVDAARRASGTCVEGALYFHKNQPFALAADQIHFATATHTETVAEYLIPLRAQP